MTDQERIDAANARIEAAHETMVDAIALSPGSEMDAGLTPQDLRLSIEILVTSFNAFVGLMIAKGAFTQAEYFEAVAVGLETELGHYAKALGVTFAAAGMAPIAAAAVAVDAPVDAAVDAQSS